MILPGSSIPKENWFDKLWMDKWVHVVLFGLLVITWCWGVLRITNEKRRLLKAFFIIAAAGIIFGAGMEFVQKYLVSNRSFDLADIAADTIGCCLGLSFSTKRYIKK